MIYTKEMKLQNEDGLWAAVERKESYIPAFPPRITFQTSRRCNLSCRMCYHFSNKYIHNKNPMDLPAMDIRLVEKVAEEMFPTLQYYEATLLGDPFLSPHLDRELELAARYNVYFRPTTNGTMLTEANLEKVNGRMDWLKCSFDSHKRSIYNNIRIGAKYEDTVRKLKRFAKFRETMDPVPYFRLGLVLNSLNVDHFVEYVAWAHEELGVDDVEMMGINVDAHHIEALGIFDEAELVNKTLDEAVELALDKKYKLRLDFTRMPAPGGDRFVCQKRSAEIIERQKDMGFIPPRNFEKMSYVIQNPRSRRICGPLGYVFSNNMRRQDLCEEFFNRPFIGDNGNVEACGNCNTFLLGNLKHLNFAEIWNNELVQDVRRVMYEGKIKVNWYPACNDCICMGVTYDRGRSDHRKVSFYRVTTTLAKGEGRVEVGAAHGPVEWPHDYAPESYHSRVEEYRDYEVVPAKPGMVYLSDIPFEPTSVRQRAYATDKLDTFTPLVLSRKRYIKGIYAEGYSMLAYTAPDDATSFKAVAGFFDAEKAGRHIGNDRPGFKGQVVMKVLLNGKEVFSSGRITPQDAGRSIDIPVCGRDRLTLIVEPADYNDPGCSWAIWAEARFTRSIKSVVE